MRVRDKKIAPAHKGQTQKQPAQVFTFPAPEGGWYVAGSEYERPANTAAVLDNFICGDDGVRVRGGRSAYATLGGAPATVYGLFKYKSGSTNELFAALDGSVFDVTGTAANTGETVALNAVFYQQFSTAGGDFLYVVPGGASALLYDGTTWTNVNGASTPAITGVATGDLSYVWSFAQRLWFVEQNTQSAWYLPSGSIAGAATEFPLRGVFRKGGNLLFGFAWTMDSGEGPDDYIVFVSDEGEAVVYTGTDPASDFSKAGVYDIGKPMGKAAFAEVGGDVWLATSRGLVSMIAVVQKDVTSLEVIAPSAAIAPHWQDAVDAQTTPQWVVRRWDAKNLLMIAPADFTGGNDEVWVKNLRTGAWSRWTGLSPFELIEFDGRMFMSAYGDPNVYELEDGGSDLGAPYTAVYAGQPQRLGGPNEKTVRALRPLFTLNTPIDPVARVLVGYGASVGAAPASVSNLSYAAWVAAGGMIDANRWHAGGLTGVAVAPEVQATFDVTEAPDVRLIATDVTYTIGGVVS